MTAEDAVVAVEPGLEREGLEVGDRSTAVRRPRALGMLARAP